MIEQVKICDGCEKRLALRNNISNYHIMDLHFETVTIDENTGMEERVNVMERDTTTVLCEDCFKIYIKHMKNYLEEVGKDLNKISQVTVTGEPEGVSNKAIKAKQGFKARQGTVFIDEDKKTEKNGLAISSEKIEG